MLVALVILAVVLFFTGLIALGATLSNFQISDRNQVEARVRDAERHIDQVVQQTFHDMVEAMRQR